MSRRPSRRPRRRPADRRPGPYGPAASLLLVILSGCRVLAPEEQLLTRFFEASRLHDTTRLARLASVTFDPRIEGIVDAFEIEQIERAEDGQSERLTLRAQVRTFGGQELAQRYDVRLVQKDGRWFITAISGRPAGP